MRTILVTGGAGFLGSHLIDRLITNGDKVICIDNLYTGSERNIEHLLDNPRFKFLKHDVTNPFFAEVDQIYNLACPASPIHYQNDPVQTTRTCVQGAINALELAKRLQVPVLQSSTSEVYGDPLEHPQQERYWGNVNPIGPRSCYDEGKRCAETLFFDYYRQYRVDIKVARIFNTYGPRMHPDDGRVISNFIVQALKGVDITVYGDGKQTRSFCYVDDLINGLMCYMELKPESLVGYPGPINIGNPQEYTIRELAETVIALTGSKSRLTFKPLPTDDPGRRQPDISRAKKYLQGWEPRVDIKTGLERCIEYFDGVLTQNKIVAF